MGQRRRDWQAQRLRVRGFLDSEREPDETEASHKSHDWLKMHHAACIKTVLSVREGKEECRAEHAFLPEEAKTFLTCTGRFRCGPQGTTVINSVNPPHKSGRKTTRITVDSGAAKSVIPADEIMKYKKIKLRIEEWFQTASGEPVRNEGEQRVPIILSSGQL